MRFLSIIFSFYIVSLMIVPALEMIDFGSSSPSCSITCCVPSSQEQPTDNGDDGCNDLCNPFLSCCTCSGFISPTLASLVQSVDFIEPQNSTFQQSPSLQYSYSIWHPPKLS